MTTTQKWDAWSAVTLSTGTLVGLQAGVNVQYLASSFCLAANNLSDLTDANTAQSNLGLGTAATRAASNASYAYVASVFGATVSGNIPKFSDLLGTIVDSAIQFSNSSYSYAVTCNGATTGLLAKFGDTKGSLVNATSLSNPALSFVASSAGSVVANHVAVYVDTNGSIGQDAANAINFGNFQAGASGHAGGFISYPATAASGNLALQAVASAGDYAAVISNASLGQAVTWTLADPANATSNIVQAPAALVSGNLVKASGTVGLVADTGIPASSVSQFASVAVTAAQLNGAYATPYSLVSAPGSGKYILLDKYTIDFTYGSAQFTAGGLLTLQLGNTAHAGGVVLTTGIAAATFNALAANSVLSDTIVPLAQAATAVENQGLYVSNATQAFATGTGCTMVFNLWYRVVSF